MRSSIGISSDCEVVWITERIKRRPNSQIYESWLVAAVIRTAPTTKMTELTSSAHFLPTRSVIKKQNMAPKKAPAWNAEVMLLEILFATEAVIPKSLLKLSLAIVVPMKAES